MRHYASPSFWQHYDELPERVRRLADRKFELLKRDPRHPSLHLKRIGDFWSVRITLGYRALATNGPDGPIWFWIGSHDDYARLLRAR